MKTITSGFRAVCTFTYFLTRSLPNCRSVDVEDKKRMREFAARILKNTGSGHSLLRRLSKAAIESKSTRYVETP